MPRTEPLPDWSGEDAYVIGGGPSLRLFPWQKLIGLNTIGCNEAFIHGVDVVNICIWGDHKFWVAREKELGTFEGWVVTNYRLPRQPPWLIYFFREPDGLHRDALGWNGCTGAGAVNLALILGAQRVFLLGFDLRNLDLPSKARAGHWHDRELQAPASCDQFEKFQVGFETVEHYLPKVFPGRQVFNVTDGFSALRAFPRLAMAQAGL